MKSKYLTVSIIVIILGLLIVPSINAAPSKKSFNNNLNVENLENNIENYDCLIMGATTYTKFIKPFWSIFIVINATITFGRYRRDYGYGSGDEYREPARGWIWTNGSRGVLKLSGDSLWGLLGTHYYEYEWPSLVWNEVWCFKGATGFTGIIIGGFSKARFIGRASHVEVTSKFPGIPVI
jgi:hypothetical protein